MKVKLLFATLFATTMVATAKENVVDPIYTRSSLSMYLIEELGDSESQKTIVDTFKSAATPDKFNEHNTALRSFDILPEVTGVMSDNFKAYVDPAAAEIKGGGFQNMFLSELAKQGDDENNVSKFNKEDFAVMANEFFLKEKIAQQMLDRWFISENGTGDKFSEDLIIERGLYGASAEMIEKAKQSEMGVASLNMYGMELLNNTFAIVNRYMFLSKDQIIAVMDTTANTLIEQLGGSGYAVLGVKAGLLAAKAAMGDGYYVVATSYLFKLDWNDEVQAKVFEAIGKGDIEAYRALDVAKLVYIGGETAMANTKAGMSSEKTDEELTQLATLNATDAAIAKLEKKYDVFKTKTPILVDESAKMITAKVGMKEGLEPKDKYEVLERIEEEGKPVTYKSIGTITVSKKKDSVWDNRHGANDNPENAGKDQFTKFDGFKNGMYSGCLIRQIK